jgi:hypothetical protein
MHLVDWIAGADQSQEFRLLSRWFRQVCQIRERFATCMPGDFDPLGSNETASVGFLAAAASRSGLLTLTDYVSIKRGWEARAPYRLGRCDLWVADPLRQLSLAFEFKQGLIGKGTRIAKISKLLDQACSDARRVDRLEADHRFGAMVIGFQSRAQSGEYDEGLRQLSARTSYCCRICGGAAPVWIYLESV